MEHSLPEVALDNSRVVLSHCGGELGLVVVHEIWVGHDDLGDSDLESVRDSAGAF